ncbi:ribosomal protein L4 domain-containing protein [Chytridium lagenaria]|nr:ribosomal protein L4 domain-containing protein [Chytridium lagenaria]
MALASKPLQLNGWLKQFTSGNLMGLIELDPSVFSAPLRQDILYRAMRYEESWMEAGTESSKALGQVRGTTRKPFPQKGRGRARHGTLRSPQFVGGYAVHGPRPHVKTMDIQSKVYDFAVRSAISAKFAQNQLFIVDALQMASTSKEELTSSLNALGLWGRRGYCLYGDSEPSTGLIRSVNLLRNDSTLNTKERSLLVGSARNVLVRPLLQNEYLLLDKAAVEVLEEMYKVD